MVVNQDEAIRCLSIAKNKLAQGDYEAALKFTNKSLKLHYSKEAELFLERLESDGESPRQNSRNANSANANDSYPTSDNLRRRKESKDEGNTSSKANYTAAQLQSVKQILSIKHDYYKVLSLEKGCEEVEIKKSYRKVRTID
ncbi:putative J domain-containing protein [Zancudomyces culisetae]|uniref:Putative J domain-containing protein n=1 Tax=Zancudomyces culisetae TaxID=1213189 RepID=A0A1R1PPG2_ZANCU|nr:putative J domain-containing protein [Zancudomyces culisetae]|eukprot:OMH82876.1 putative J domain-containing protein [Zancudomyces culisetae]